MLGVSLAQTDVYFKINHKINKQNFSTFTVGMNNVGDGFTVSRLQYYVSKIKIIHDSGQELLVDSLWILVDAKTTTNELLGSFNITTLESVKFSIGVESDFNHLDTSLYDASHALAPKSPSMHWGWTAGYRFLAMEGYCKSENYQLHGLGDVNYFEQEITTSGTEENGDLIIHLEGNYEFAVQNISIASGVVSHGETGAAKTALTSFRDDVFDVLL